MFDWVNSFSKIPSYCERCGERLDPKKIVWLELSQETGLFTDPDIALLPEKESQGGFTFGKACAKAVLANGGDMVKIERKRRLRAD
jgi:hypothetical protein